MKGFLVLFPVFIITVILYHKIFGVYFSQDDFFHIIISKTDGSINSFINLFGFYSFEERGIAFYRPVFREVFFNIFYSLFGLNVHPYRIYQLGLHLINILLVYTFFKQLFKDRRIAYFTALMFGISAINVATLYYLTGGIQALGATTFVLLTLLLFKKHLVWSFLTFLFALGSHELAIVTPLLLFLTNWRKGIVFFVPTFIYLYLEISVIGFSANEIQYQAIFSIPKIINTYGWYIGWALGLPEMLIDFVRSGLQLNPGLMRYWGNYYGIIFPSFFIVFLGLILVSSVLYIKNKKVFLNKNVLLLAVWFIGGLMPVAILPWHKSTYYLYPVLAGFMGLVSYTLFKFIEVIKILPSKMLVAVIMMSLIVLNISSILLGDSTYWAASRGRLAQKLIGDISSQYPTLPEGAVIYFKNDPNYPFVAKDWGGTSKQASIILNRDDALRLYYNDPTLEVYYEDLDGTPTGEFHEIIAKIN